MRFVFFPLMISLFWLVSCTTAKAPLPVAPSPTPTATELPSPTPTPTATPTPAPTPEPTPAFEVSAEKKEASLAEIKVLVTKLNGIISEKDFSTWKTYLDKDYVKTYGDPVRLKKYSEDSPFLKQYNVKLKSLEDFFSFVVVPSRADVTVDDISFVDENRVEVWTVVDNERVLLYLLKLYGNEWKISSW